MPQSMWSTMVSMASSRSMPVITTPSTVTSFSSSVSGSDVVSPEAGRLPTILTTRKMTIRRMTAAMPYMRIFVMSGPFFFLWFPPLRLPELRALLTALSRSLLCLPPGALRLPERLPEFRLYSVIVSTLISIYMYAFTRYRVQ